MSSKKVSIGGRPTAKKDLAAVDKWVENRAEGQAEEPMKRLTIDIPADLHRTIKAECAMRGTKMANEIRELLLQKYGNE